MYKDTPNNCSINHGMYKGINVQVKTLNIMIPVMIVLLAAAIIYLSITGGYTVTFTDGEVSQSYYKIRYGESIDEPEKLSKDGYVFDGWYTDPDYTSEWDFDYDYVSGNTVLYAKWEKASADNAVAADNHN